MTSRYNSRSIFRNQNLKYENIFKERNVKYLRQYDTPSLVYPTPEQISSLNIITEAWKAGDRYWKYAYRYYNGRSDLWWVIAWFNQKPTEGELEIGDSILIPTPIDRVLEIYGY